MFWISINVSLPEGFCKSSEVLLEALEALENCPLAGPCPIFSLSQPKSRVAHPGTIRNLCIVHLITFFHWPHTHTPRHTHTTISLRGRLSPIGREIRVSHPSNRDWDCLPKTSKATWGSSWSYVGTAEFTPISHVQLWPMQPVLADQALL
jgi:hypothetical protein